ncbi:MAG: hypothetical protein KAJ75_02855 [Alphaproteobacteria bacterium]|nr:hypothetical protein [Alphaproteobacteria bacterium]
MFRHCLLLFAVIVCFVSDAFCAEKVFVKENEVLAMESQLQFTAEELSKFIKDWAIFKEWANSNNSIKNQTDAINHSGTINDFITKQGWKIERYFYMMTRISTGIMSIQTEENKELTIEKIRTQKKQINENDNIPDDLKTATIDKLDKSIKNLQRINVLNVISSKEKSLIKANFKSLKEIIPTGKPMLLGLP